MNEKLPEFLRPFFWDVDFGELDRVAASNFILKRIIDRGDARAWKWAQGRYSLEQIKELMIHTRDMSRKSARFWSMILNLDPQTVPCLYKPYSRMPFAVFN